MSNDDEKLTKAEVPVGIPLDFSVVNVDGARLLERGVVLQSSRAHRFLFDHFTPFRAGEELVSHLEEDFSRKQHTEYPLTIKRMGLEVGGPVGVRSLIGVRTPMHSARIIGFAPNDSLFITHPMNSGNPLNPYIGESMEILAVGSRAVFLVSSLVEFVGKSPLPFVIVSGPISIRKIRERNAHRVAVDLPLQFSVEPESTTYEGLGLLKTLSVAGLSFISPSETAEVGTRIRVSFELKKFDLAKRIQTVSIVRNITPADRGEGVRVGVEFEKLDPEERKTIKIFLFDRLHEPT